MRGSLRTDSAQLEEYKQQNNGSVVFKASFNEEEELEDKI